MKPFLFKFFPMVKTMLDHPQLLNRTTVVSIIMGVIEGVSLFLMIPAISALSTGTPVWGLGTTGWIIVFGFSALLAAVFGYIETQRGYEMALDLVKNIHRLVGNQVAKMPLGWFSQPIAGRLSRMVSSELMLTGEIVGHMLSVIISRMTVAVVVLILTLAWDLRLGAMLALTTPIFVFFLFVSSAIGGHSKRQTEPAEQELSDRVVEFTHCQPALRAAGRSQHFQPLIQANRTWKKKKNKALLMEILAHMLSGSFVQILVVTLIMFAAYLHLEGAMTPIVTIAFMGLALRYSQVLFTLGENSFGLETRRPMLEALHEVLVATPLPEPAQSAPQPDPGSIEFEDVTFGYNPAEPVVKNISFRVEPETMVALVGPSGCGKTTLARLVSRFYEVDSGAVKVGGTNVKDLTTETLMGQLSMVFQDVYLFDDTLIANIRIGRPTATDAEVQQAAQTAGVSEIVERLPLGWQTQVGEGGKALSGGERQRVAIARALLKDAPIVLLDEATSALDPENEANIVAALEKLRSRATIMVIAHKLDTIRQADKIVALGHDGRVEDIGTHAQLYARGGTYQRFWDERAKATGWQLT